MKSKLLLICSLLWSGLVVYGQEPFTEVAVEAGIDHAFEVDMATFGGGVAVIDYNNDGFEDLYIAGGVANDALYKNNGDGTFIDVIENSGFGRTKEIYTQGATAADVNRDGFKDLLVTTMNYNGDIQNPGPNLLYINNGDGTFTDQTKAYGLDDHRIFSTGATFGDVNADGYPDLYVSNYFYLHNSASHVTVLNESIINDVFIPAPDWLFINSGGDYFIDASDIYDFKHVGYGFQGIFTDYDNDGDLDLHIANDFGFRKTPNIMLRNEYPQKKYTDRSNNLALNYGMNAMGIARGDYNQDGWMDYFVTNLSTSLFTENQKNGDRFEDVTSERGLALVSIHDEIYNGVPVSWGANFFDYDHDLDVDLFVANGALNPTFRLNPNLFYECDATGDFTNIAKDIGLYDVRIGRGSVVFDYDNDGDMDLFVVNQKPRDSINLENMPPARNLLYRNDGAHGNWLKVALEGVQSDLNGIGSKVELEVGGKILIREIDGGSSHLSQNSTIAHFGLGEFPKVDKLTVKWVGGKEQVIVDVSVNQMISIKETDEWISAYEQNDLKIFPNYFEDQVMLEYELNRGQSFTVDILDQQGRIIDVLNQTSDPASKGFLLWDVPSNIAPGLYFFRLATNETTIVEKGIRMF